MTPEAQILLTRRMPPPAERLLRDAGLRVDAVENDAPLPPAELLRRVRGVSGLICSLSEPVDTAVLEAAGPSLRVVANFAVGVDNIDVPACTACGVRVTNTPDILTDATADLTWALILATARRVVEGDRHVRSGEWKGWTPTESLGVELTGATLGIVGAGRIGTAVGLRSRGFGMRVLYVHPRANATLESDVGAERVDLDRLLRESDILTLHVPMTQENHHLIDRARLARMKPTAILINTARGPIVDEVALLEALRENRIDSAGLDVFEHEPRLSAGLSELANVVLLPHVGSATTRTRAAMSRMAAENVIAVLTDRPPPNPVN
ncbi:MAG: D-glycerate dehydrogenase [Planctomycetes bacterium]|nr:D-glycerate dehydrogenase [Planctomycetota bacterium]